MLNFLPGPLLGILGTGLAIINTVIMVSILIPIALLKLLMPAKSIQKFWTRVIIVLSDVWISNNNAIAFICYRVKWEAHGVEQLNPNGWYLVVCNHQSWVDILTLQTVFKSKIPFLKFFLKKELIWVPFLGLAWWALDFPFMKRYSKAFLEKKPHLKGKDIESTRKACQKFQYTPVSVMNFLEGTRFDAQKHQEQQSPYQHLLKPKSGGIAFVLSAMEGKIDTLVDVTIQYHDTDFDIWSFLCGKVNKVSVHVTRRKIPDTILNGDYENDPEFRQQFQDWVSTLWQDKDLLLTELNQVS